MLRVPTLYRKFCTTAHDSHGSKNLHQLALICTNAPEATSRNANMAGTFPRACLAVLIIMATYLIDLVNLRTTMLPARCPCFDHERQQHSKRVYIPRSR